MMRCGLVAEGYRCGRCSPAAPEGWTASPPPPPPPPPPYQAKNLSAPPPPPYQAKNLSAAAAAVEVEPRGRGGCSAQQQFNAGPKSMVSRRMVDGGRRAARTRWLDGAAALSEHRNRIENRWRILIKLARSLAAAGLCLGHSRISLSQSIARVPPTADADDASCRAPRAMNCTDVEIRNTLRLLVPKATEDMSRLHQAYDRG
uniref:Uncharacterized protein n=1 Tax=Oryza brachyantha TaxID=4533 RepID=J3LD67_ORYBR